jgi:hypothetical protein
MKHIIRDYGFTANQYRVSDWLLSFFKDERFIVDTDEEWLEMKQSIVRDLTEDEKQFLLELSIEEFNSCSIMCPLRIDDMGIPKTKDSIKRCMDLCNDIKTHIFYRDDPEMANYVNPYRNLYDMIK